MRQQYLTQGHGVDFLLATLFGLIIFLMAALIFWALYRQRQRAKREVEEGIPPAVDVESRETETETLRQQVRDEKTEEERRRRRTG